MTVAVPAQAPARVRADYRVSVVTATGGLDHAWPGITASGDARCHVFQTREYLALWQETIGAARRFRPLYVRVDQGQTPLLLLPLGIEKRRGLRILSFADGGVADYNAPVLFPAAASLDAAAMQLIWQRICALVPPFDLALLEKMPDSVKGRANPMRHLVTHPAVTQASSVTLDPGRAGEWPAKSSVRNRRKLDAMGGLELIMAADKDTAARVLEAMIQQKTRRYIETRGWDGFDRPGYRAYFRRLTEALAAQVHLSAISVGGEIVAAHWGLITPDRFYYLMPSHADGRFAPFSPGRLLMEELISWSAANGLAGFDMGTGSEAYKDKYCDLTLALSALRSARTVQGRVWLAAMAARRRLGKLRNRLRAARLAG